MTKRALAITIGLMLFIAAPAIADTLKFNDGSEVSGIIRKVENGKVYVTLKDEEKIFDILEIETMDFDTPHLIADSDKLRMEHFLKSLEAQELVRSAEELEKAAADIRKNINEIRTNWGTHASVDHKGLQAWEATKANFKRPLSRYQEVLNDLYFHVFAKVDEYNGLMKDATDMYVGVKGLFKVGSPLVSKELEKLPLKKYVPGAWFDTIYYQGYNRGYDDAYLKYGTNYPDK
jgi:hypothetical protein